ncbi:MAG: glycosyltransferase family 1 protein, partial [Gammaproteobacteria bacterium]|nr:glycosyltransferase family 1 protein [Gammaproteobacteria bacterium]
MMSGKITRKYLHVFPTFCAAGAQVRAATLMRLAGADCSHSIVALDGRTDAAALAAGVPLEFPRVDRSRGPAGTARALRALLRRENPDLLLSYNWGA